MSKYLKPGFLFQAVAEGRYIGLYLYIALASIALPIVAKIYLARKNRPQEIKGLDNWWFWGYLIYGIVGLFIYFAKVQALPIFSTRAVSYLWLAVGVLYGIFLIYYLRLKLPERLKVHYEKARKAKYLKK